MLGHTFAGWTLDGFEITTIPTGSWGDKTLIAQWTINTYTVAFNSNGGDSDSNSSVTYNNPVQKPDDPHRIGYIFDGWYKESTFDNPWDFNNGVTSNLTLFAKWTVDTTDLVIWLNTAEDYLSIYSYFCEENQNAIAILSYYGDPQNFDNIIANAAPESNINIIEEIKSAIDGLVLKSDIVQNYFLARKPYTRENCYSMVFPFLYEAESYLTYKSFYDINCSMYTSTGISLNVFVALYKELENEYSNLNLNSKYSGYDSLVTNIYILRVDIAINFGFPVTFILVGVVI